MFHRHRRWPVPCRRRGRSGIQLRRSAWGTTATASARSCRAPSRCWWWRGHCPGGRWSIRISRDRASQQFRLGMADECAGVFVGLLLAFSVIGRSRDIQRLARTHVAGLAAVHDVGVGNVDLNNLRVPVSVFLLRPSIWVGLRSTMWSVTIRGRLVPGIADRFQHLAQFSAQLGALVFKVVVILFQFVEVVLLSCPSGNSTVACLFLVFVDVFLAYFSCRTRWFRSRACR